MRVVGVIAIVALAVTWQWSGATGEIRCSYVARFPPATGQHTFLMGTATSETVTAPLDTSYVSRPEPVPAQVMAVDDVAGYQAESIRRGLRESGGTALFVRYGIGPACEPLPVLDGAPDSAGVNGLYVGHPRPRDRWIEGRPTFDILRAAHFPLPQRLSASTGHLVMSMFDPRPMMTAAEIFTMYRALWAESVSVHDTSIEPRIRNWLDVNPEMGGKRPAEEVASGILLARIDALVDASPIPFGGTFEITLYVPGADSLVMYGRTAHRARPWIIDLVRDSITDVPVAAHPESFAIDVTTAPSADGFERSAMQTNPCPPIPIVIDELPIIPDADSTWQGKVKLTSFLECAPAAAGLSRPTGPEDMRPFASASASVVFRRHVDGSVSFESLANESGSTGILVRGERISTLTYGRRFD